LKVIAILNVVGNVMIPSALLNAILSVRDLNAKYTVRRLLVLLARFTVISPNVMYAALRICARRLIALSVRLFALQLSAVLLVLLLMLSVLPCAKRLNANGNARSLLYALVLSVS
jgi:hypothetical protein